MRNSRVQFTRGEKGRFNTISVISSIVLIVVGLLMCQPFFWTVIVSEVNFHYITIPILLMLLGIIFGLPMMFGGIILLLMGRSKYSNSAYNDHDLARIRHAVEMEKMNGK